MRKFRIVQVSASMTYVDKKREGICVRTFLHPDGSFQMESKDAALFHLEDAAILLRIDEDWYCQDTRHPNSPLTKEN
jgi:hypothetical protein